MKVVQSKLTANSKYALISFLFILTCAFLINYHPVHATSAEMITKVNEVLEVSLPSDNILLNLNPTETGEASGEQDYNIIVATNHIAGYNLVLSANSTDLTRTKQHQSEPSATIPTVAETEEGYTTPNDFDVNHWGFKLGSNNYNAFKTSQLIGKSTGPVRNDEINLKFASKVNFSQPAGTYNLTINFNATANIITGVEGIVFNGNGADNPDAMSPQMISAPGANLNTNQFTRDEDWRFVGWNTEPDGTGTAYTDGAEYLVTTEATLKTTILYAQWAHQMQKVVASECVSTHPTYIFDARDEKLYRMRRINGVCTMIDNLRVDMGQEMTPEDTNIASGYVLPKNDLALGNSYIEARTHKGDKNTGNWYNYCAATAGEICQNSITAEATQDVCPKNWRLPSNNEQALIAGGGNNVSLLFNAINPGGYFDGSIFAPNSVGYWWSSTPLENSGYRRHYLTYSNYNDELQAGLSEYRDSGFSVRCVLK